MLTYGVDVIIPIEIRAKSFYIQQFKEGKNEELMITELDLLEEIREETKVRSEECKKKGQPNIIIPRPSLTNSRKEI